MLVQAAQGAIPRPGLKAAMVAPTTIPNTVRDIAATNVTGAIRQAAKATGTDLRYLLAAAKVESNLDPSASARTSSAGGLFQFIDQTWLGTIKQSGAQLGYGKYADAIQQTDSGKYVVSDASLRKEIMALRKDPAANAVMAGAFTKANATYLTEKLGRQPTDGELYMAHFLGARGAAKLISLAAATPNALAKDSFPRAAVANKSIFFGEGGRPRSFSEVTASLSSKYAVARAGDVPETAPAAPSVTARVAQTYAAAAPAIPAAPAVPVIPAAPALQRVAVVDDRTFKNPYRPVRPTPGISIQTPAQRAPASVAPDYVPPAQPTAAGEKADWPPRPAVKPGEPLNLFQDSAPNVRALFGNG